MKTVKTIYKHVGKKLWRHDPFVCALEFARKNPDGLTLRELCQKFGTDQDQFKNLRTGFINSGTFSSLNKVRDDNRG